MVVFTPLLKVALLAMATLSTSVFAAGGQAPETKCVEHNVPRKLIGKPFSLKHNREAGTPDPAGGTQKWEISPNWPVPFEYPYHGIWFYVDIDDYQTYTIIMMSDLPRMANRKFIVDIYDYKQIASRKSDWHPLRSFYITGDELCSFVGTVDNEAEGPITITVTEWQ